MPDSDFDIDFAYRGNDAYEFAFQRAANRWEQIITTDLPDVGRIDDLFINARVTAIDGPGGTLGQAAPTYVRTDGGLPSKGFMEFDRADIRAEFRNGTLVDLVTHEMGHVLGLGTLWDSSFFDFVNYSRGGYTGENALQEYRRLADDPSANFVPLETGGGPGTAYAHWSERVFDEELMTGYAEAPGPKEPISRVTIGALEDLGYAVRYAEADPFSLSG